MTICKRKSSDKTICREKNKKRKREHCQGSDVIQQQFEKNDQLQQLGKDSANMCNLLQQMLTNENK